MFFNTARLATRTAHPKVLRPSFLARLYAQRVVSFHYTLTNQSGAPLDSSRVPGRAPLTFLEGSGQIIPGLETEVIILCPFQGLSLTSQDHEVGCWRQESSHCSCQGGVWRVQRQRRFQRDSKGKIP